MPQPDAPQRMHVLERTSPKGEDFIGRCTLCGQDDLGPGAAWEACPSKPTPAPKGVRRARGEYLRRQ